MRLGHKNRVVKVVTSKGYVWEPCKTRAFTNPDSISISLVSLYTETLILHSALAFIKGFCFFLSPSSLPFCTHSSSSHTHSPVLFLLRAQSTCSGDDSWGKRVEITLPKDPGYISLDSLIYWYEDRPSVYWMIFFTGHPVFMGWFCFISHCSISLQNLTYSLASKISGLFSFKTTSPPPTNSCYHPGSSKGDCESWFWPNALLNRDIHCIAYMHK